MRTEESRRPFPERATFPLRCARLYSWGRRDRATPSIRNRPELGILFFSGIPHAILLVSWSALSQGVSFRVTETSGESFDAELVAVDDGRLTIDRGDGPREFALDELLRLESRPPVGETVVDGVDAEPAATVTLRDGSEIVAGSVSLQNDRLTLGVGDSEPFVVPARQTLAVRFGPGSPATDPRWLGLLDEPARGDRMVIRRDGGRLDAVGGVIEAIDGDRVRFTLGGDTVQAPIERLEGLLLGGGESRDTGDIAMIVRDTTGSVWRAERWRSAAEGGAIELSLPGGLSRRLKVERIASVQFQGGLLSLADQTPASHSFDPYLRTGSDPSFARQWFGPRPSADGSLTGVAGTTVEYRVEPGFSKLLGTVRRAPDVATAGRVGVRVALDEEVAWEQVLNDHDPIGFELDLGRSARIRLEVLPDDDGSLGDRVEWMRLRLVK